MTAFDRAWGLVKEDYSIEQCDSCGDIARVAELGLREMGWFQDDGEGGSSAIKLCRDCWANEMEWRQAKNEEFAYQMEDEEESMFPILPFPSFPFTEGYE